MQYLKTNKKQFNRKDVVEYYKNVVSRGLYPFEKDFLSLFIDDYKNKNILDLGCGAGREAVDFAKRGAKVTAVDFSKAMLKSAKKNCKLQKLAVKFIFSDCISDSFYPENGHDIVFATHNFIEHIVSKNDRLLLYKNIFNSLNENGYFIFSFHEKYFDSDSKRFWDFKKNNILEIEPINKELNNSNYLLMSFFTSSELGCEMSSYFKIVLMKEICELLHGKEKNPWHDSVKFVAAQKIINSINERRYYAEIYPAKSKKSQSK